jgi:hypothetical protein
VSDRCPNTIHSNYVTDHRCQRERGHQGDCLFGAYATPDRAAKEEPMFVEDIDGVWHARRDDFWDNDINADVRAHAACGADVWSCHVSAYPPVLGDAKARHCRGCFPLGRKRRV